MRKQHRRADWLYSAQLVASLVRIAVSVIFALIRKTLLVTVSFQLKYSAVSLYTVSGHNLFATFGKFHRLTCIFMFARKNIS